MNAETEVKRFRDGIDRLRKEIAKVIVGQDEVIRNISICLLAGGHALLEGVPGIGKTLMVRTLSRCLGVRFSRIQFTPDLMPADIIGTNIVVEDPTGGRTFKFQPGPVFGNIVLADEVNRATPKTQSALLEAMQEHAVTVAGVRYPLEEPFFVLATQNPIEMEGTYPLPEAQLDRFLFKVDVGTPSMADLVRVVETTTGGVEGQASTVLSAEEILAMRRLSREVPIASHIVHYAAKITLLTHPSNADSPDAVRRYVRYGSSPRGAQALVLAGKILALLKGRYNVSFEDIREVAAPALRHRLVLNFEADAEGIKSDAILKKVIAATPELPAGVEKLIK
ncbi:MAG: MoxR family ATPase [Planctomycetota bacterium]|nr:MoxR family ATPase [Planctomycetota bacterium]